MTAIPRELETIVMKAIAKNPRERFTPPHRIWPMTLAVPGRHADPCQRPSLLQRTQQVVEPEQDICADGSGRPGRDRVL